MNLQSIVTLLQLVLALLSNPQTANNPQIQALAGQAIITASQALAVEQTPVQSASSTITYSVPSSTENPQPIVINVTTPPNIGVPDLGSIVVPPVQACSLQGTYHVDPVDNRYGYVELNWQLTGMDASTTGQIYFQTGQNGGHVIWGSPNPAMSRVSFQNIYSAHFGGAVCYAFFPSGSPKDGDMTTNSNPFNLILE